MMINNLDGEIELTDSQVQSICSRRFGVGSDGLILIESSPESDFHVNFFNPDASKSFCGNGSRCAVHFANAIGAPNSKGTFTAIDGLHHYRFDVNEPGISLETKGEIQTVEDLYFLHTGSPHLIQVVDDVDLVEIADEGKKLRHHKNYQPEGTNVNFVEWTNSGAKMRTFERGVEAETFSCGTGVTAVGLLHQYLFGDDSTREIHTKGGTLNVQLSDKIWLFGPTKLVYSGELNLNEL